MKKLFENELKYNKNIKLIKKSNYYIYRYDKY